MVKVKICGITDQAAYLAAINFNADYTGFIFYEKSTRFVTGENAGNVRVLNGKNPERVGVFVNEDMQRIREIYNLANLDIVQLHGDETPEFCEKLGLPFWKAIRMKDDDSIAVIDDYNCDTILIDTYNKKQYGGTGKVIDLKLIELALKSNKKIIVAGGLSIDNIHEILKMNPYGVDISSSVELIPGKKDLQKMKQLFEIIQEFNKNNEAK
jgi:phosphoribosylanthranilate isomerase